MQRGKTLSPSFLYEVSFQKGKLPEVNNFTEYFPNLKHPKIRSEFIYYCFNTFRNYFNSVEGGSNYFYGFRNWLENENPIMLYAIVVVEVLDGIPDGQNVIHRLEYSKGDKSCTFSWENPTLITMYVFLMKFCCDLIESSQYNIEELRIYYLNVMAKGMFPTLDDD